MWFWISGDSPILEVGDVSKTLNGIVRALNGVGITVKEDEIVSIVGENGAGKSTSMKILVGMYELPLSSALSSVYMTVPAS